jgi:D-serine deaminase-like pyridoxal phosphate-dependent protein
MSTDPRRHHEARFDELAAMVPTLDTLEYQTPFLVVDLDAMERNLERMAAYFADRPAALRPHLKHHKCTEIARMQLDAGATGITCATSDELAAAVRAGIRDVLVANVVTDRARLASIAQCARNADVTIAVDSDASTRLASAAATGAGSALGVLVEYDIGMRRSGVGSIREALELAALVAESPGLSFRGIQAYEGNLVGVPDRAERAARVRDAFSEMPELLRALADRGFEIEMFTGGAASTYDVVGDLPYMTDVQAGTYVLMDATYVELAPEFEPALAIVATVATARRGRPLVVDVGAKRMSTDWGEPALAGYAAAWYATSEEHCRFVVAGPSLPAVGERVAVIPGHACPTVALYGSIVGWRRGRVERVFTIDGRDQGQTTSLPAPPSA